MKRHTLGLVGFVGSVLASIALVLAFNPSSRQGAPAPGSGRTYGPADIVWDACALDVAESGKAYACSDGSRLFFVEKELASPERARAALQALRAQAGVRVIARDVGAVEHTFLVFATDQVEGAHTTYGSVWVDGSHLVGIYGPSPSHVLELEAANPDWLW